jgi:hypothetical protein
MIDKMLVFVISGGLAVILTMQLLLCSLPLFRRLEYDAVCHKYTMQMDRAGGLDDRMSVQLAQDLNERGFLVTRITATRQAGFGDNLDLYVTASIPTCRFGNDLAMEEVSLSFAYQSSTVCRILKSYAAAP